MKLTFYAGPELHKYQVDEGPRLGGIQYIYAFPNGYGVSLIKSEFSYGGQADLWEIAVIEINSVDTLEWNLCYDTPVSDDVIGYLTDDEAREIMKQVFDL